MSTEKIPQSLDEFNEQQEREKYNQALTELINLRAMKVLAEDNELGASIQIATLTAGVSVNKRLLPIINAEISEIKKFLNGKPNNWE